MLKAQVVQTRDFNALSLQQVFFRDETANKGITAVLPLLLAGVESA
jgi:hypothetical protein